MNYSLTLCYQNIMIADFSRHPFLAITYIFEMSLQVFIATGYIVLKTLEQTIQITLIFFYSRIIEMFSYLVPKGFF